jgi:hypothetical protein
MIKTLYWREEKARTTTTSKGRKDTKTASHHGVSISADGSVGGKNHPGGSRVHEQ